MSSYVAGVSFEAIGLAYGIRSCSVVEEDGIDEALAALWQDPSEPFLLEVAVEQRANAYPKIAFGQPISEMEPLVEPTEMEGT